MRLFKLIPLVILTLTLACGTHHSKRAESTDKSAVEIVNAKAQLYRGEISDIVFIQRCDKLAFKPYLENSGVKTDLSGFETNGRWNRDAVPCYPEFSGGTISFDGLIAVFHYIWTTHDVDMLNRFISYSEAHGWIIGEGSYSNQMIMAPIAYNMRNAMKSSTSLELVDPVDALSGFRGHLLASYLWLQGRVNGQLSDTEMQNLRQLFFASPEDPIYVALYHRFTDGDQTDAYAILATAPEFPSDRLPLEEGVFHWGSSPASVIFLMTLDIIEGR